MFKEENDGGDPITMEYFDLQVLKEGDDEGDPIAICGRAQKRFSEEQSHHARCFWIINYGLIDQDSYSDN